MLVAQAVIRHSDELESDLLMHFGVDLRDFWVGKLSIRRVLVLVRRLLKMNGRSALCEAMVGESAAWSNEQYMMADIRDSIESGNYLFLSAHKGQDYQMPEFKPYPRPGWDTSQSINQSEPEPEWASAQDISNLLNQMRLG